MLLLLISSVLATYQLARCLTLTHLQLLVLIHVSCVKPRPTVTRLPVLSFSAYTCIRFQPRKTNQCKRCDTMSRVNVFENVFLKNVLVLNAAFDMLYVRGIL